MPWNYPVIGTDIYHIVQWFFIYSILGWVVESIYMSFCEKRWVNRGFIFGPICPIYGFGAVAAYFILEPLAGNYVVLFIAGSLLATGWEWFVAKVMLHIFGEVWWDYSNKPFNYNFYLTQVWIKDMIVVRKQGYKDIFIESLYPVCTLSLVSLYGFLLQ